MPPSVPDKLDPINEDWQVGDLAECLIDACNWMPRMPRQPDKGDVFTVVSVGIERMAFTTTDVWALGFAPFSPMTFTAVCFRKVHPLTKAEERDLKAKIKRRKPVSEPA